jgi:hypothetical protein
MNHSSVIVNHRVASGGSSTHKAIGSHRLNYIATRIGVVKNITEDDLLRQAQAERMALLNYVNYRLGAVAANEESRNALFNQQGIADFKAVRS